MDILDSLLQKNTWEELLQYKKSHGRLGGSEERAWHVFLEAEGYRKWSAAEPLPLPVRKMINKSGTAKKRVIYSYPEPFNSILKGISFLLYRYDGMFCDNCYAFRRAHSVGDAIRHLQRILATGEYWCLKADISDYFNSIDPHLLLRELSFLQEEDAALYALFEKMLLEERVAGEDGRIVPDRHGAMAGIPVAPFFANVYLRGLDALFRDDRYFRYSDDILILAADEAGLYAQRERLFAFLDERHLQLNREKLQISPPGEPLSYLGFSFCRREIDLSEVTAEKMKARIRRKARALRRWCTAKKLPGERAAKGFIRVMNRKFFSAEGKDFSWSRWFFPYLTTDASLRDLDACMQQYIRFCVTGRHSAANFRVTYEQMKAWGYRSLVHEWWEYRRRNRL